VFPQSKSSFPEKLAPTPTRARSEVGTVQGDAARAAAGEAVVVAVGRGGTEVGVAVTEGTWMLVACTGTPVDDTAGEADSAGLGVGVAVGEADGVGFDVGVTGTTGVAVGWTVESRAIAVRGGTVGTNGSGVNGLGCGAG